MCSSCNSTKYGQEQPEARKADVERLKRVLEASEAKAKNG